MKWQLRQAHSTGNVATKSTASSGNVATKTAAQAQAEQYAEDAYGDSDPVALLEEFEKQNQVLRKEIAALEADNQKAETIQWKRIAEVAIRRQNELMDSQCAREGIAAHVQLAAPHREGRQLASVNGFQFPFNSGVGSQPVAFTC